MSVKKMLVTLYSVTLAVLIALGTVAILLSNNQELLQKSQQARYESYLLADELRQSSFDLTRLARTYTVTSNPSYEALYWEILDIRNGKKPRADGRTASLRKLMENLQFSQQEFAKLKEAEDNSNNLVKTETIAMNAVKGLFDDGTGNFTKKGEPDLELARRIMHDDKYHQDVAVIMKPVDEFFKLLDQRTRSTVEFYQHKQELYLWTIMGMIGAFLIFALVSILITVRSILKPMGVVVEGSTEAANQVTAASLQVGSASQQVADGASQQAAAVEETASSLEEMSSMVKLNAANSSQANQLMKEASHVVERANQSMKELTTSMQEIYGASEETQKIIKTIDEIAFQTNLLALNAAVEAARAGEAGAGFGVVADEVRNLALRAAEAAKNTAELIEGTVRKVKDGTDLVHKTNTDFHEVAQSVLKSEHLIAEITVASQEQAQGVEQVSRAMGDVDKVTQQNAANAEETASASEEMSAQAEQLKAFIQELTNLLGVASADGKKRVRTLVAASKPTKALTAQSGFGTHKALPQERSPHPSPKWQDAAPKKGVSLELDELNDF